MSQVGHLSFQKLTSAVDAGDWGEHELENPLLQPPHGKAVIEIAHLGVVMIGLVLKNGQRSEAFDIEVYDSKDVRVPGFDGLKTTRSNWISLNFAEYTRLVESRAHRLTFFDHRS